MNPPGHPEGHFYFFLGSSRSSLDDAYIKGQVDNGPELTQKAFVQPDAVSYLNPLKMVDKAFKKCIED